MEKVTFIQEAGRRSQTLRFEPDRLIVALADDRKACEFWLAYSDIDVDKAETYGASRLLGLRWGGGTRFPVGAGRRQGDQLNVWRDKQHDSIVAELAARWKAMRREIVRVDFEADAELECARFSALQARGFINAEECAAAIARIRDFARTRTRDEAVQ